MSSVAGVTLVPLNHTHSGRTREWANDPIVSRLMNRQKEVSETEHAQWFASVLARKDCLFFAVEREDRGRHVGNVWLWNIDERHRKAELRIVIGDPSARGHGVGSSAIDMLVRYAFEVLSLHKVYAHVMSFNPAARHAFEKAGFQCEGTLRDDQWAGGRYVDVDLMARLAGPMV